LQPTHVERGRHAETIAAAYLSLSGYRILERNHRFHRLEIDIIARIGNILAVVEVKYRRSRRWGGAVSAVSAAKQRDLETAAVGYLLRSGLRDVRVRFDVITLDHGDDTSLVVRHMPGAFSGSNRYRL
jgi:putative endonuclease